MKKSRNYVTYNIGTDQSLMM